MEKMEALFWSFCRHGMLEGSCTSHTAQVLLGEINESKFLTSEELGDGNESEGMDNVDDDVAPVTIHQAQSSVIPAARYHELVL